MTSTTRRGIVLLVLAQGMLSCDGFGPLPIPTAPPPPAAPPITVTSILPNVGSTGGGTPVVISGTGFRTAWGAPYTYVGSVTIGGIEARGTLDFRDPTGTIMYLETPAHGAGAVDIVLTNLGSQPVTLAGAYTYALPESFDFNGDWSGFGNDGQDIPILFTIRNNALVSVSCDTYRTVTFSPPVSVNKGEFAYSREDGLAVSGRIVGDAAAVGTVNLAPCTTTNWVARKY